MAMLMKLSEQRISCVIESATKYVKTVPLAAQMLDVRRYQKLEIIEELKTERGRFELEVEIGKSPPLSDDEVWWELRHKALELREEWRLENRRAFANIWSDTVYGISLFILLYFNKSKVALLKFTGYKIINNISDTGKAFLIILITDIFLGLWENLSLTLFSCLATFKEANCQCNINDFLRHHHEQLQRPLIGLSLECHRQKPFHMPYLSLFSRHSSVHAHTAF
ncbi:Chloroplast envelope membrane protein [Spatholobus suberectus]|nr:Chloroplast envelope membrane protein [Spatholobus suberectus]